MAALIALASTMGATSQAWGADTWVELPVLRELAGQQSCDPVVEVTNTDGADDAVAVMLVWGEEGFCAPQSSGPLTVLCSEVIGPGGSWTLSDGDIPAGTVNARGVQLLARPLRRWVDVRGAVRYARRRRR